MNQWLEIFFLENLTTIIKLSNILKNEKSPYLQQHKDNPVDWFPWNKETLDKAKKEKKPIFLSVGYASCHWCHVMAHESFENEETAKLMNEKFINIVWKVREPKPIGKGKITVEKSIDIDYNQIKEAKVKVKF